MSRDLLTFHHGLIRTIPSGRPRIIAQPHVPTRTNQVSRLSPIFRVLSDVMSRQCATIQQDIQGLEPEFVLVFEVAGNVSDFYRATQRAGMEWICDFENTIAPDDDFYNIREDGTPRDSVVSEKLYLTMTNQVAMQQLMSLWEIYSSGRTIFPEGMTPFRDVFAQLKNLRRWNIQDRFDETNVVSVWQNLLDVGSERIRFEIELWYRKDERKRIAAQDRIISILQQYGGVIVKSSVYNEIGFHGLLVDCPADEVRRMIENRDHELLNADQIMSIRATGQVLSITESEDEQQDFSATEAPLPTNSPVIALLDGLPLANHQLLANRLSINDVDGVEEYYQTAQRVHGTSMASLIIHGDLNHPLPALKSSLYVRPIMRPNHRGEECVPDDIFFVDAIHNAIREIGEDSNLSNSIRIVNLSLGNPSKPFVYALSAEAKMLDWLSCKYNLLIIVSSGNCPQNIELPITLGEYKNLSIAERQKMLYNELWANQALMKIYCPSESINGICVGAAHFDYAQIAPGIPLENPIEIGYPASYSCFGGGYHNSIKPDLIVPGGQMVFQTLGIESQPATLRAKCQTSLRSTGQKVAAVNNGVVGVSHCFGTSNSTALSSRICADFLDVIRSAPRLNIPSEFEALTLKTMLIHSCAWGDMGNQLMNSYVPDIPRKKRVETLKWIGYGLPHQDFSSFCTDQRVTLIGYGEISQNQYTDFKFPLPDCLISVAVNKRLTISMTWFSPIAPNNKNYRLAKLLFEAKNKDTLTNTTLDSDVNSSKRGTAQHEVYEGHQASTYIQGSDLCINVLCKKEPSLRHPVRFVIMATLEVAPETQLPLYNEIAARVQTQVQV